MIFFTLLLNEVVGYDVSMEMIMDENTVDQMNALGFYLTGLFTDGVQMVGIFEPFGPWSTN